MFANGLMFFFVVVLLAFFAPLQSSSTAEHNSVAMSFLVYRVAVSNYVVENPGFVGEAPLASLSLPSGYVRLRTWRNYVDASAVYAYGPLDAGALSDLSQLLNGSMHVGKSLSGNLVSPLYGPIGALPGWMPDNQLVSMLRRQ